MKHVGLFAFGLTTCVLVPTALHVLQAGPEQVAKLAAPGLGKVTLGKAEISIKADQAIVEPGKKVHVTLTASAEGHEKARVALLVYESQGSGGGRVESPPALVGREEVVLDTQTTPSKTFAFTLSGQRGENMDGIAAFGHYTILAMAPADADRLEKLHRRADRVNDPMSDPSGRYGEFMTAFYQAGSQDTEEGSHPVLSARIDVNTRPTNSVVSIVAPDHARVGDDIEVAVLVKNTSRTPVAELAVALATQVDGLVGNEYLGLGPDDASVLGAGEQTVAVGAHETARVIFHVRARGNGVLGLYARTRCDTEACYANNMARSLSDVALDAVDIAPSEHPPMVVEQ